MVFFFPTGKLPSRRWRPVAAAGFLLAGLTAVGLVLRPRLVQLPAPGGTSLAFPNPFGVAHFLPLLRAVPIGTLDEHQAVPLGNSVSWCELGFCCGISSVAGTISGCCCRSSTAW